MDKKLNLKQRQNQTINGLRLLSDQALGEAHESRKDGLGFDTYASVLANVALGTSGPFTIGIFGEWGTGKTSLMKLVEGNLQNSSDVVVVWFNAWMYEKEEHPIVPLVATIVKALEKKRNFLDEICTGGKSIINALRAVAYGFSSKSKVKIPGFAEIEASFVAREMIDREEALRDDPLLTRSLYFEAFEKLLTVKLASSQRVVVLIDDLDRCFPDQAIRLLESIKLVLNQPGFIFVLGVARKVIEGYLEHRYKEEYGITGIEGQKYLDKIVQLAFQIPPHRARMKDLCSSLLKQASSTDRATLAPVLHLIEVACESHPRAAVRFVNNLILDRAISEATGVQIDIAFFVITRSLQHRWGILFSTLEASQELCEQVATWDIKAVISTANQLEGDAAKIAHLLSEDPDLVVLLGSKEGKKWLMDEQKRKTAIDFLHTQRDEGRNIRVYEVAQQLGIDNKEVMARLSDMGKEVKNHMAILDQNDVSLLLRSAQEEVRIKPTLIRRRARTEVVTAVDADSLLIDPAGGNT